MTPGAPTRLRASRASIAVVALCLAACTTTSRAAPSASYTYSPPKVIDEPNSQTGPYVVVAVDNHFHDIHPSDPPSIRQNRPFIVKNEGQNLHNFTVVRTGISVDIEPGHELRWNRIGDHLKPGFYTVSCKYHAYLGMTGNFYVTK